MSNTSAWLLAQRHNWERLGDRFSGEHTRVEASDFAWLVVGAAGAVLAIWWLATLAARIEGRSSRPRPGRLFRELCRAHKLSSAERALLKSLAENAGVENTATLFVRSDAFDSRHAPNAAAEIQSLRAKLFSA